MSLHKISSEIHILAKWLGIVIGGFLALYILYAGGLFIKEIISPTPPPPPTVSFGQLPSLNFATNRQVEKNTYILNTVTGKLPNFPDRAKVFQIKTPTPNLLALQRAREKVAKIGFSENGIALSPIMYQWNDASSLFRRITVDVVNFNFDLTSSYMVLGEIREARNLPTEPDAIETAESFLDALSALPPDLDANKTLTTLYKIENGKLIKASSFSQSNIIRVDLFQKPVDNLDIYYPNPPFSTMNFLVAGGRFGGQIVEAHFFHQEISEESATYPIITAEEGWNLLEDGKAHIASNNTNNGGTIAIRNIKLGYYLNNKEQKYLMPIMVFEGDNDFYAYISAVKNEWIEQANNR